MSTDPQGAGWADTLRLSRRTLLRFLPRRLTDGHAAVADNVDSKPPETVTGGELSTHSPRDLGRFLERLESNAALTDAATRDDSAVGADPGKDDRGPEEEL